MAHKSSPKMHSTSRSEYITTVSSKGQQTPLRFCEHSISSNVETSIIAHIKLIVNVIWSLHGIIPSQGKRFTQIRIWARDTARLKILTYLERMLYLHDWLASIDAESKTCSALLRFDEASQFSKHTSEVAYASSCFRAHHHLHEVSLCETTI